jgi:polysaccharide export outer membrane protein
MNAHPIAAALLAVIAVLAVTADGPALAQAPPGPAPGVPVPAENGHGPGGADYRIGPEDVLQISVWKNEGMSRTVPVRPDGMVSLPLLNDVLAAGLTPMQLRDVLMKKLAEYEPTPEISVIVQEVKSFKVSVIGEVAHPGRFELKSRTTVLDVIAQAGGFNQFASRARIVVLRTNGAGMKRVPFNYNKVISADGEHENLVLQPGDIVVVP